MKELIDFLSKNGFTYFIENNVVTCLYAITIIKNGHRVTRHYPYDIDNLVSPRDLIEDIKGEFNE